MDLTNKIDSMEELLLFDPFNKNSSNKCKELLDGTEFTGHVYPDKVIDKYIVNLEET